MPDHCDAYSATTSLEYRQFRSRRCYDMSSIYASRHFAYSDEPEVIRRYITELGHSTDEIYDRDTKQATGFAIRGTTVRLGYHLVTQGMLSPAHPTIFLLNTPKTTGGDLEMAERSIKLYQQLYRRFRKRRKK